MTEFLSRITQQFIANTGLKPLISAEIEFYLPPGTDPTVYDLKGIETYGFERERGENQYELALKNPTSPLQVAEHLVAIKQIVKDGIFIAKPYPNQPGSGLHIHLSLLDKTNKNLFAKTEKEEESITMRHAIAGLLDTMLEAFTIFAPNPESYSRFSAELNNREPDEGRYNNAPVNVSWGGNNRTTAIRIPASSAWPANRHIEHRVAGSDADPYKVIAAILLGVQQGLFNHREPPAKIWGDATHPQYGPPPAFPKTLEEARLLYNNSGLYDPIDL